MNNPAIVDHSHKVRAKFEKLWPNLEDSDVVFIVDQDERFPCHKMVLADRSEYFRALLYNGMLESSESEIRLYDTPGTAFKTFLRYIYTGFIDLSKLNMATVLDLRVLGDKYGLIDLENAISRYLKGKLRLGNAHIFLKSAMYYSNDELLGEALLCIDENPEDFLRIPDFTSMESELLELILKRDSFSANEDSIFHYVKEWFEKNKDLDKEHHMRVIESVRFTFVTLRDEVEKFEVATGLIGDIVDHNNEPRFFEPTENVATIEKGAQIVDGTPGEGAEVNCLINGNANNYRGFYMHQVGLPYESITIQLAQTYLLKSISFLLFGNDTRSYSYYVETSLNGQDWTRVADNTEKKCQSWQRLEFRRRPVKYIKIVGTNSMNMFGGTDKWLRVVHFECPAPECGRSEPIRMDLNHVLSLSSDIVSALGI